MDHVIEYRDRGQT